jgi:hypothetical protein
MDTQDDLNVLRNDLIERIKVAFPKHPPIKGKHKLTIAKGSDYHAEKLRALLDGKRWDEVIDAEHLIYAMTDYDYLQQMEYKAFLYFLPAFFIAALKDNSHWTYYHPILEDIFILRETFSIEQLEILISFLDFHSRYIRFYELHFGYDPFTEAIEDTQLRLMLYLDEKKKERKH